MTTQPAVGRVVRCANRNEVGERAAALLSMDWQVAAATDRTFAWVAAGGPEAEAAFDALDEHVQTLPWHRATVLMGDERCAEPGDERSNWTQLNARLLSDLPTGQLRLLRPPGERGAQAAAASYESAIVAELGPAPVFDQLWLGVGANGHTLSLFPGRPVDSRALVMPVHDAPDPPPERISLTFTALQHVRRCVVLAAGEEKRAVVHRALDGDLTLPITEAVHVVDRAGGEVTWLLDDAACG